MKPTICIETLGCKVNFYESEAMANLLTEAGYEVKLGLQPADIYIINTCAVTNEAEKKSRNYITKVLKLNPNAQIYVCGCSSQRSYQQYQKPNVKAIFGTAKKMDLAKLIISLQQQPQEQEQPMILNYTIANAYEDTMRAQPMRTRGVIKVQDGCNSFCTYCIIPYVRGRSRSRTLESIQRELSTMFTQTSEIVVAGVNLTEYGKDLHPQKSLADVAELFRNAPVRFRFSSLEAGIITEEFLQKLVTLPNFCPHFHLSMQSGCNKTLKNMNRKYTVQEFIKQVQTIRFYFPNAGITTDVIVGFPTETEADFEETMQTVRLLKFSEMHIFPYSKRSGTFASKLENVATNVKQRVQKLTQLAHENQIEFLQNNLKFMQKVLIERKEGAYYRGFSENYIECLVSSNTPLDIGTIVKTKPLRRDGMYLIVEPVV